MSLLKGELVKKWGQFEGLFHVAIILSANFHFLYSIYKF